MIIDHSVMTFYCILDLKKVRKREREREGGREFICCGIRMFEVRALEGSVLIVIWNGNDRSTVGIADVNAQFWDEKIEMFEKRKTEREREREREREGEGKRRTV